MINLKEKSKNIRLNILRLANKSKNIGAHIAPSLSIVEILSVLFCNIFNNKEDIFILSKGHAGLAYYAAMYEAGLISKEQLDTFENNGGEFPGQPTKTLSNGVCFSSGSLGLGLSYASGLAYAKKMNNHQGKIYVLVGNGELNEGSNWEALMFIKSHRLENIVIIIDDNEMQSDGKSDTILNYDINNSLVGFGFDVIKCDGHNEEELIEVFNKNAQYTKVILAKTIKGKGVSFMERNNEWHHAKLSDEQYKLAIEEVYK